MAWYYNQNTQWHQGRLEAAMTIKNMPQFPNLSHGDFRYGTCIEDLGNHLEPGGAATLPPVLREEPRLRVARSGFA